MEDGTAKESSISGLPCGPAADDAECPVRSILDRVGDKWAASVITQLAQGTTRFSVLKRQINGISQRMLTETLRKLERDGLLTRTVYPTIPPRVDYGPDAAGPDAGAHPSGTGAVGANPPGRHQSRAGAL